MSTLAEVIEKVRKLRALAGSTNPHEAATAAALADKLIQQHRLEEASLEVTEGPVESVSIAADPLFGESRRTAWKWMLAAVLCAHYDVASWSTRNSKMVCVYKMLGRPSDVASVRYMFAWLVSEIEHLYAKVPFKRDLGRDLCIGVVHGISAAIGAARRAVETQASASTAIVLASRMQQAEAALAKAVPNLRSGPGFKRASRSDGYMRGVAAGARLAGEMSGPRRIGES